MGDDHFTMIVDQILGHYARVLQDETMSWPDVRESIALVIGDHQNEVGDDHEGIARLLAFSNVNDGQG